MDESVRVERTVSFWDPKTTFKGTLKGRKGVKKWCII